MFLKDEGISALTHDFPKVSTIFDHSEGSPHSLLYGGAIRNALHKLLPSDLFFEEGEEGCRIEELAELLPILKWWEWGEQDLNLSFFLLCRHRVNAAKFFYEMISRWLMPGKRLNISSFFSTDFKLAELSSETFTLCEVAISWEDAADRALARQQIPIIESEIRLGLLSVYHASRILEIKGLSADEKTSLVQERIAALLEKRPRDFDHGIFSQMQHFLVMCSGEFKAIREYAHMSRIIYVFYLFRKALKQQIEKQSNHRFIHLKLRKAYLHLPFGVKRVLGVFIGLNFLNAHELFEARHCERVLKSHFPELKMIEHSFFSLTFKEERVQLLYFEVEKENEADFSLSDLQQIKGKLPGEIRNGIEKLMHPLFMPRNEEEVMRNIITLSLQLRFLRDLPQVILSFDEQAEDILAFTVIWVRVAKPEEEPISVLFEKVDSFLTFQLDRFKKVGLLRKKYSKEAAVFRVRLPAQAFLRPDHSVDLFKARQAVVQELHRLFGEFRDYNGGMLAKQHEQFNALANLLPALGLKEALLLENFFHSIFPIELRCLFNPLPLKKLFTVLLEAIEKNSRGLLCLSTDEQHAYFLATHDSPEWEQDLLASVKSLQIPHNQMLTVSLQILEVFYLGIIYQETDEVRRNAFLTLLQTADLTN